MASEDRLLESGIRVHLKKIKKLHTFISTNSGRQSKSAKRAVKKAMKTLIERTEALSDNVALFVLSAQKNGRPGIITGAIADEIRRVLHLVKKVTDQSCRASVDGEKVPAKERIFSIFEEHTELLKRGKAHKPNEFGHLVTLAQTAEKFITYYNIEEQSRHDTVHKDLVLKDHKKRFGTYPKVFTADKNYYTGMEDVAWWEERVDTFAVGKKGKRDAAETAREHSDSFAVAASGFTFYIRRNYVVPPRRRAGQRSGQPFVCCASFPAFLHSGASLPSKTTAQLCCRTHVVECASWHRFFKPLTLRL